MNHQLLQQLNQIDERYLRDGELSIVHDFCNGYTQRINIYRYLQENSDALILRALRTLTTSHRQMIQQNSDVCRRDMSNVLRYAAVSILKNDEQLFIERLVLWMQNILYSMHLEKKSIPFYLELQNVIRAQMLQDDAVIVNHYISILLDALRVGEK